MSMRKRILRHYEPRIDHSRPSHDVLDWSSAESQKARLKILADNVSLHGRSLLDVCCGLADLFGYLQESDIRPDYTGVDISEKMLAEARRRHPEAFFVCADLFGTDIPELPENRYDVVYCSGIFNLNLGNNEAFLPKAIERLKLLSGETLVFNLLHSRARGSDRNYAYYDPDKVLPSVSGAGWETQLLDDYLPNDFTIICRRLP